MAKLGNHNSIKTSSFAQYEHLDYLSQLTKGDARLAAKGHLPHIVVVTGEPVPARIASL
ncbi:MAG: hypothetical protein IJ067_09055 [Prevotella sp.]|nr:hypothetical protein [Prevotella sp.]